MSNYPENTDPRSQVYPNQQYGAPAQPGFYQNDPQQPKDPNDWNMIDFRNYRFSPEELRVLKECELEANLKRSIPLGFGLGLVALLGVRNGVLQPNIRFGPWPKVIGSCFLGYFIGRVSYLRTCQEKLMALPNSMYAEVLRRRSRRFNQHGNETYAIDANFGAAMMVPTQPAESTDNFNQPNALNLDTSRPYYNDLNDHYVPTHEGTNDLNEELNIPTRKNVVSYDELRQKNRDDFMKSQNPNRNAPYQGLKQGAPLNVPYTNPPYNEPDRRRTNLRARPDDAADITNVPKNRYGDSWSE